MDAYSDDEWADSDLEPDTESSKKPTEYKPSYVLIAIDTDKSMFENINDKSTSFSEALNSCYEFTNSLVLSSQHSLKGPVGIVLADNNTIKSSLVEFEQTVPDTIKLLKSLKEESKDELKSKYERNQNFDLADFFLFCKNKLLSVKADVYKRIVIYITNDDNPVQNDAQKRFKVINESQKFSSIQMELVIVTFNPNFDYSNLYSEVFDASNSKPLETVSSTTLTEKLKSLIQKRHSVTRCKFYPFLSKNESYFEVAISRPIKSSIISKNMYVTRSTQQQVKKTIKQSTADTYTCEYSKNEPNLVFNQTERQNFGQTALPIGYSLAYVAHPVLKPGWVIKPPYLMEKYFKETSELFEMFWQFCRDQNKCLVCYQKLKTGGDLRFVELIPKCINGSRHFLVKTFPYSPEIFYNPNNSINFDFTKEEENAMESVVEALTFNYDVDHFRDPIEAKKEAYIKSQLLEEKMEHIIDGIESDEVIDTQLANSIKMLTSLNLLEEDSATKKRSRNASQTRSKKK